MPTEMMIRRLRVNSAVSDDEAAALRALPASVKEFPEETSLVSEGERPTRCIVIMSGFAFRSKVSDTGKRQILSFHPAGDMPDLHGLLLDRMDHDLVTLSPATVAFIEHRHINRLIEERPNLARVLWREARQESRSEEHSETDQASGKGRCKSSKGSEENRQEGSQEGGQKGEEGGKENPEENQEDRKKEEVEEIGAL